MDNQTALYHFKQMYRQGKLSNEEMQIIVDQLLPNNQTLDANNVKGRTKQFTSHQESRGYQPVQLDALGLIDPMDILFMFLGIAGVKCIGKAAANQQQRLLEMESVRRHIEHNSKLKSEWEKVWDFKRVEREQKKTERNLKKREEDKKKKKAEEDAKKKKEEEQSTAGKVWEKGKWIIPPAAAAGVSLTLNQAAPAIAEAITSIATAIENAVETIKTVVDANWNMYMPLLQQAFDDVKDYLKKLWELFKEWIPYIAEFVLMIKNAGPAMVDIRELILEPYSNACRNVRSFRDELRRAEVDVHTTTDAALPRISFPNINPQEQAMWSTLLNLPIIGPLVLQPQLNTLLEMQKQARSGRGYSSKLEAMSAAVNGPNPLAFTNAAVDAIASSVPSWFMIR